MYIELISINNSYPEQGAKKGAQEGQWRICNGVQGRCLSRWLMKAITFCSQGRLVVCHYVTAASAPHFCTVKSFPHYQYMLRKVANQGKSQYSSFCRVEQQALCHRTSINHLSSLRRCTLSLNTVLVALTHFTNIVFRLAWYTLHGMHFFRIQE